jgi:hypothetical protein
VRLAIMQPYFLPYIGYFQLINSADKFVIYDNIEFTKKGWINRNRMLVNNRAETFTLPLKKDSDFLHINQRFLSDNWDTEKVKLVNKIKGGYQKAPYYKENIHPFIECIECKATNLFDFNWNSVVLISRILDIKTEFVVSSTIDIDHNLKSEEKVKAICLKLHANEYINPIGGQDLYDKMDFLNSKIDLKFIQTKHFTYTQFNGDFVPFLSILDLFMFNSVDTVKDFLNKEYIII